jgi:nuclease-like protein
MASRTLALRRADRCAVCASELPAGTRARWDGATRTVTCLGCVGAETGSSTPALSRPDPGAAGTSAGREYERRRRNREQRTRTAHPHVGGLLLALQGEPQHQLAFRRGQDGEVAVAESLRRRTADSVVLLHDRRMPRGSGNIDHLVIAPTGVYVVDAKDHKGRVSISSPLFGEARLMIDGRDRTKLIDGLDRQVAAVRHALATSAHRPPVHGVLCFTKADLPLLGTTSMRAHLLVTRKGLAKRLNAGGPLSSPAVDEIARALAAAFPPA